MATDQLRLIACAALAARVFGCATVWGLHVAGREVETMKTWFERLKAWFKGEDDMTVVQRLRRLQGQV